MRLQIGGACLLLLVGLAVTGCGAGVSGPVVTAQNPAATSAATLTVTVPSRSASNANLIPNGSFEDGIAPWQALSNSELELGKLPTRPKRFGRQALLVHPKKLEPFGAWALIVGEPVRGTRYRFTIWLEGTPSTVLVQLQALASSGDKWLNVGMRQRHVTLRWQRYSVSGSVPRTKTVELRALVSVQNSITHRSWLALDGVTAVRLGT